MLIFSCSVKSNSKPGLKCPKLICVLPDTLSQATVEKRSGVVLKPIRLPCDMCIYGHDGAQLQWHFDKNDPLRIVHPLGSFQHKLQDCCFYISCLPSFKTSLLSYAYAKTKCVLGMSPVAAGLLGPIVSTC